MSSTKTLRRKKYIFLLSRDLWTERINSHCCSNISFPLKEINAEKKRKSVFSSNHNECCFTDAAWSYHGAIMDNPGRIKSIMFMSFNCGKTDTRFSIKL